MNKIYNRKGYNFKEDIKSGLIAIFWIAAIVCGITTMLWGIDKIDQYKEEATVIKVEPFDEQVVTFETESGNIFVEYFDYEYTVKPQNKAILTIKDFEDGNKKNDIVVGVKWVE